MLQFVYLYWFQKNLTFKEQCEQIFHYVRLLLLPFNLHFTVIVIMQVNREKLFHQISEECQETQE